MLFPRVLLLNAAVIAVALSVPGQSPAADDISKLPRQHIDLVAPPFVHPH
jgi:nitrite reductase (NO-forming)